MGVKISQMTPVTQGSEEVLSASACIIVENGNSNENRQIKLVDYFPLKTTFNTFKENIENTKLITVVKNNKDKVLYVNSENTLAAYDKISLSELDCLQGISDNIQKQLNDFNTRLNNETDSNKENSLQYQIDELNNKISNLESTISSLEQKLNEDFDSFKTNVSDDIKNLKIEIENFSFIPDYSKGEAMTWSKDYILEEDCFVVSQHYHGSTGGGRYEIYCNDILLFSIHADNSSFGTMAMYFKKGDKINFLLRRGKARTLIKYPLRKINTEEN